MSGGKPVSSVRFEKLQSTFRPAGGREEERQGGAVQRARDVATRRRTATAEAQGILQGHNPVIAGLKSLFQLAEIIWRFETAMRRLLLFR